MQAIFVADIVLLLVLAALMAVLCGYGAYGLYRAMAAAGIKMPPLIRPKSKAPHQQQLKSHHHQHEPYDHQLYNGHSYPCVHLNPLSELRDPMTSQRRDLVTSPSPAYEPMFPPTVPDHSTGVVPTTAQTQDNRLCGVRDWRYTEYQI